MNSVKTVIRRHWQVIVFVLGLVIAFLLLWLLRNALLPFLLGFILASLLLPVIRWVEKRLPETGSKPKLRQLIRISIILVIYLLAIAVIALVIFYIITLVGKSLGTLTQNTTNIIPNALDSIKQWLKSIPFLSNPSVQQNIDLYAGKAEAALPALLNSFLLSGVKIFQSSGGMILGFIVMPIFMFLILKDWDSLRDKFYAALPPWSRTHTKSVLAILQNVVVRYIRAQLIVGLAVGLLTWALLFIMKIQFALPLAVFAGIMDMVPMIGPWLGGGLIVLITLVTAPGKVLWVAVGYLVIQQLEIQLLAPRIRGSQMRIHPAFIIMFSVLGAFFAGIIGFIIVLPLVMIIMGLFKYFRDSTRDGSIT